MFNICYDSKTETVQLIYPNGKKETLADEAPTVPVKSPDNKKAVYISPLEWEVYGKLYLVNLENGEQNVLIEPENSYIPKNVIWLDNEHIITVIGFGDGTVQVGGNIFIVNIETKEKKALTKYDSSVQITDIIIEEGILKYRGIKYIDEQFGLSEIYTNSVPIDAKLTH